MNKANSCSGQVACQTMLLLQEIIYNPENVHDVISFPPAQVQERTTIFAKILNC
jgi:hypothetical protein